MAKKLERQMYEEHFQMVPKLLVYKAVIPLNPITKKNHQQILINRKTGKPFVSQSSRYKQYENECGYFLKRMAKPIDFPVNVKCVYYCNSRRKVDLVNLLNATFDIIVQYGIIVDDNRDYIYSCDGSVVLYDKEHPRTEITITKIEGDITQWGKKSK